MGLIVEDGTGVAGANGYVTADFYKTYWKDRGTTVTSGSSEIAAWIIQATDFIERVYGPRLLGVPEFETQPLSFPRLSMYDRYGNEVLGIPVALQQATAEYASRVSSAQLLPDPVMDSRGRAVTGYREKLGPIETETRYSEGNDLRTLPLYPAADRLMQQFISKGGVIRA